MPTTTNYALRYPALGDAPNVPLDMQELASDTDLAITGVANRVTAIEPVYLKKTGAGGQRVYRQDYVGGTTDASGFLTVTHTAPFTPTVAFVSSRAPGSSFAVFHGADAFTATNVRLRFMNASTGGAYATGSTLAFTVIYWE